MEENKKLSYLDIVTQLIGSTTPIGKSEIDKDRLENLKELCELTYNLLDQINYLRRFAGSHEHSVQEIGIYANRQLREFIELIS